MAVEASVTLARDVNPEYLAVGGLEDELVEVGIVCEPLHPLAGFLYIGETIACRILEVVERNVDVGSLTRHVLRVACSTYSLVECLASVSAGDGYRLSDIVAQRLKYLLAEVGEVFNDSLIRDAVVDVPCYCR